MQKYKKNHYTNKVSIKQGQSAAAEQLVILSQTSLLLSLFQLLVL